MSKTILPPSVETFLSSELGAQLQSALRDVYENLMLDTSSEEYLTRLSADLGIPRPPLLAGDDDFWRAAVKKLAYTRKHTRPSVGEFFSLILGPKVSQVSTVERTVYVQIANGDSLTISAGSVANVAGSPYTVNEVLTHHLIFPAGTFTDSPDLNITYLIEGTTSKYGNITTLSDGRQALVDTTVSFVNTHAYDYLTKLNTGIPQYGKLIFDKNSATTQEKFSYEFYDNKRSGILKLDKESTAPSKTRNKYVRARSSVLNAAVTSGALSLTLQDPASFPVSPALIQSIQVGDQIIILSPSFVAAIAITGVSKHEITVGGGLPVPAAPADTDVTYIITTGGTTTLSNGRGHFLSKRGKILSATMLVDYTKDFTKTLKPVNSGTSAPFSVVISRGADNEETLEVLSRSGSILNLVVNPEDTTEETSLLKFNHERGETIEVVTKDSYSTGSYFPLTGTGVTVGTISAGSTASTIRDTANSPFLLANAEAGVSGVTYGDELEIVTTVAGGPAVGERRTIITYSAANQVVVDPPFSSAVTAACTYRVRKLYKAVTDLTAIPTNKDQYLYLKDTTMFPAANFSVILDRGTEQEEVTWIDENNLTLNRLRIANGDWWSSGAVIPYLTKEHDFGVKVEPAQVLVESCPWEIIETRATGEYTIAIDDGCVPENTLKNGWFIHEKTPTHLVNTSSGAAQVGAVRGNDVIGGVPQVTTKIPKAPPQANIAVGDTSFKLTHANYVRILANFYDPFDGSAGETIFRPIFIEDTNNKRQEVFATSLNSESVKTYGQLVKNANPGDTSVVVNTINPGSGNIVLGQWGAKYKNHVETVAVSAAPIEVIKIVSGVTQLVVTAPAALAAGSPYTIANVEKNILRFLPGTFPAIGIPAVGTVNYSVGAFSGTGKNILSSVAGTEVLQDNSVNFLQPQWKPNQWKLTVGALTYPHFKGESVNLDPVVINTNTAFANPYATADAKIHYVYTHPTYRHKSDMLLDPSFPVGLKATTSVKYPASTDYVRRTGAEFSRYSTGDGVYVKHSPAGPAGERRSIAAVGGINNEVLFVGEHTKFGSTVDTNDEFDVRAFVQSGDISETANVDISGNENAAFGAPGAGLNTKNLERYLGGHKTIFPGSYLYRLTNYNFTLADQPSHQQAKLRATYDPTDPTAVYKFPGPRRLIAPPAVSFAEESSKTPDNALRDSARLNIASTGDLSGKYVEILSPIDSRDYRRKILITSHVGSKITLAQDLLDKPGGPLILPYQFRVLNPAGTALSPTTPTSGSPYFWVDYPEFFPDLGQNNFTVVLDRNGIKAEEVGVIDCVNTLGPNYGRFALSTVEAISETFVAGDSVELKIEKISLNVPVGTTTSASGGFYLGFGFEPDQNRVQQIGLGADPVIIGAGKGNDVDNFSAGALPPTTYIAPRIETLHKGTYYVSGGEIKFPTPTLSNTRVRCSVLSTVAASVDFQVADFNFLKQKYRWFLGATVLNYSGVLGTISAIDPATSTITMSAAVTLSAGDPIVIFANKVPVDNKERQSDVDDYFTFGRFGTTTDTQIDGIFPTMLSTGVAPSTTEINFTNVNDVTSALIGHRIICVTTGGGIAVGEQSSIVRVEQGGLIAKLFVSPAFSNPPGGGTLFAIIPGENFKYSNVSDRSGGVFTGINSPDPVNPAGTAYVNSNHVSSNREYGIVEEYVEYSSRSGNILTLSEPFYPKYDHLPGSSVVFGTNVYSTEGSGNDYRPYAIKSYLEVLFDSNVVDLKSILCAAGIEGKSEVTELGS